MATGQLKQLMKKCPYCAELIQDEAILCRYCGSDLRTSPEMQTSPGALVGQEVPASEPVQTIMGLERPTHWIWYLVIGLVTLLIMAAASILIGYVGYPGDPLSANYDYWANVDALIGCGVLISLVAVWLLSTRGKFGVLTLRTLAITAIWMIVPILNWAIVYYLGRGIYMTITRQEFIEKPAA